MNPFLRLHRLSMRFDHLLNVWGGAALGLFLRCFIALQFLKAGLLKVKDWDVTLSLFREEYSVPFLSPEFAAILGAGGELIFPALLLLGVFSRPAALGLFVVNAIAVLSYPQLWSFDCPAAINEHFYWGLLLLVLIATGPGKIALDSWLKKIAEKNC